ncbi:MAG: hypothetical protein IJ313_10525 [Clostridia bacterium]|nr:hypothetical protein [Clostridia bacterium]
MKPLFTPEELAELAAFDAEVDDEPLTQEEIEQSRARDKEAKHAAKDKRSQKIAENQRAYYEANREKINAYMREYRRRKTAGKGA